MSDQSLRLVDANRAPRTERPHLPLGKLLVERGVISQVQLVKALHLQVRQNAPLGVILQSQGWATRKQIDDALARQSGLDYIDLSKSPPGRALIALKSPRFWLQHGVIPWRRVGPILMVATARPDRFDNIKDQMADCAELIAPIYANEDDIADTTARLFRQELAQGASNKVPSEYSCRNWTGLNQIGLSALLLALIAIVIMAPMTALAFASVAAVLTLILFTVLKLAGFLSHMLNTSYLTAKGTPGTPLKATPLPRVSVLVPLFREREIAEALVKRLSRLTYPKGLLDVILVLEEKDGVTRDTLAQTNLPQWMRVIEVPEHGNLTTKPRAMNYALDFCKGDIIGVWDAEDAPAPDQIEHVARHFAQADDDVVCLQGILDFYNPRTNWRARCFTIEYSSWFRIVLPGIAKLGLVVPLGGTTLFFKRDVLEELGGWDAHNVTEDADLGVRLCRAGYRTELIDTVTYEEANHRAWPWIKQRSRWLKGFMVTYLVHMRHPLKLWSDLGSWRFLGFQAFFLGTIGQFLLAPLLWSLWIMALGLPHPIETALPGWLLTASVGLFIAVEVISNAVGMVAVSAAHRRFLIPWVPTMMFYLPLGVAAAYKALYELAIKPFYWDKTQHGQAAEETAPA